MTERLIDLLTDVVSLAFSLHLNPVLLPFLREVFPLRTQHA